MRQANLDSDLEHYNNKHVFFNDKLRSLRLQQETKIYEDDKKYVVNLFKGIWKGEDERDTYLYDRLNGVYTFAPFRLDLIDRQICSKEEFRRYSYKLGFEFADETKNLTVWDKVVRFFKEYNNEYQGTYIKTR
jgi:hypothetical protein